MGEIVLIVLVLLGFGFVLLAVLVVAVKFGLLKSRTDQGDSGDKAGRETLPYSRRERVLSPAEQAFHAILQAAVHILNTENPARRCTVFASVRLAEVLAVSESQANRSAWQRAFNRISSKQVDFVVCEEQSTRPLLVIELDDASHKRSDRSQRDEFVDRACRAANLSILHVQTNNKPDYRALARLLGEHLSSTKTPAGPSAS
jgi:hypothetical protein